jgi:putative selenate reductase
VFDRDFDVLRDLGVKVHYDRQAGRDFGLAQLRRDGFEQIVIMVGAQLGKTLSLESEDCDGVIDALTFLRNAREGHAVEFGERVGIIGAGDTAMDCARVARRLSDSEINLIYRRTIDQMPADREEVSHLLEEGIDVLELCKPQRLVVADGKLEALMCRRMVFKGDRDASGRKIPHELGDSDFELPLDTLILAISQHAVLDFFDGEAIEVNERGYITVDPRTFETSVSGVYAGGDVANDGPASIVKAAAAGKAIADSILGRHAAEPHSTKGVACDPASLLRRRSHRQWRIPAAQLPLEQRDGFDEVVLTYDEQQARTEASRCLDCDRYCSLCVGVCPNLALLTYEADPLDASAHQAFQVAVLADLCNECGNCTTFCPTSGAPYRDKPRLYLSRDEFEAQTDNAFMLLQQGDEWAMDARWRGVTHHIDLNDEQEASEPYAAMSVLLRGLRHSMPHLPSARPGAADTAGRVAPPQI